jgi:hypothetical protein
LLFSVEEAERPIALKKDVSFQGIYRKQKTENRKQDTNGA